MKYFNALILSFTLGSGLLPWGAIAQTITKFPGSNTDVTPGSPILIDGGDTAGTNLFHSFSEFSPGNTPVFFNNNATITHIFGRVINGTESYINSTISANNTPVKIFLINPAGIRFGQAANLAPGISFVGSTASSIVFPDAEFSAIDPIGGLLSMQVPTGLQFTGSPGSIRIEGTGHTLTGSLHDDLNSATTTGIQSSPNQTLALIGGPMTFVGGNVRTNQGRIEIGSVGANSTVGISPDLRFDYSSVQNFADINLASRSSIDASGIAGGAINIQGRQLNMTGGSVILSITKNNGVGQDITIATSQGIRLSGFSNLRPTLIATKNGFSAAATGSTGNININTPQLIAENGAQVLTGSFFFGGRPGDINVNADRIELRGIGTTFTGPSGLYARVGNGQEGGSVNLQAQTLQMSDRAIITTETTGAGPSGLINLNVRDTITLQSNAQITASTLFGNGQGGNILLNTNNLEISNGRILSSSVGAGHAGQIEAIARQITLNNQSEISTTAFLSGNAGKIGISAGQLNLNQASIIASQVDQNATGQGGLVTGTIGQLNLQGGSQISAGTFGAGRGGNINLETNTLNIQGEGLSRTNQIVQSGISTQVNVGATGQAGNLTIAANALLLKDGGNITSGTVGASPGGSVVVNVQGTTTIIGRGTLESSGIYSRTRTGANAGTVTLNSDDLRVSDRGTVTVESLGSGNAGNLSINARLIQLESQGKITAANTSGQGGNVNLSADQLRVSDRATITVETLGSGNAGNLQVNARLIQLENQGNITAATTLGQGGNVNLNADQLRVSDRATVTVETLGSGNAGNLNIDARLIQLESEGRITAATTLGQGGNVNINTNQLSVRDRGTVTVETLGTANAGNLNINARLIQLENRGTITAATTSGQGGNINLNALHIILLFDSEISTTAGTANQPGDGGNITINAATVTGLFNSDIVSNSFRGRGGRIVITAQGIFGLKFRQERTPQNDITAFSLFSPEFNGEVILNTPGIDPTQALIDIPVVESPEVVQRVCGLRPGTEPGSGLRFQGRGIPENPANGSGGGMVSVLPVVMPEGSDSPLERLHQRPLQAAPIDPNPQPLIAQGWGRNAQGQLVLTAQAPAGPALLLSAVRCGQP